MRWRDCPTWLLLPVTHRCGRLPDPQFERPANPPLRVCARQRPRASRQRRYPVTQPITISRKGIGSRVFVSCAFSPRRIVDGHCFQWFARDVGGLIGNCADNRIWTRILWRRLGVGRRPGHHRNGKRGEWFFWGHLCCPSVGYVWSAVLYRITSTDYTVHFRARDWRSAPNERRRRSSVWRQSCRAAVAHDLAVSCGPAPSSHCQDGSGLRSSPGSNALLPPRAPGRTRPVAPDRIRDHHDHAGRSVRGTDTVTFQCSRPQLLSPRFVGQSAAIRQTMMRSFESTPGVANCVGRCGR
jgi:hypothetical protein